MKDQKMKLTAVRKRDGVYEVGGVTMNATSPEEAIRKYTRRKGRK